MKKMTAIILFITLALTANAQGWKAFRKVLKNEFEGLTPYSIPDKNYEPGTVLLVYKKNQQMFAARTFAFPNLNLVPNTEVPPFKIGKVSEISFSANAESNLIPGYLSLVAGVGLDQESKFTFEMKQAEKHQIDILNLEIFIENLDITSTRDRKLLERLIEDNCFVITQALYVKGMVFSFERKSALDINTKADLQAAATNANVTLKISGDYTFTLESDSALYYAFDSYRKNKKDLQRLYDNKMKIAELEKKQDANSTLMTLTEEKEAELPTLLRNKSMIEKDMNQYEAKIKADSLGHKTNWASMVAYNRSQLERLQDNYDALEMEIEDIQAASLEKRELQNENNGIKARIQEIQKQEYDLFIPESAGPELELFYGYDEETE